MNWYMGDTLVVKLVAFNARMRMSAQDIRILPGDPGGIRTPDT